MGSDAPWVLQGNALLSLGGPRVSRRLSLTDLHLPSGTPRLAVDTDAHRLWIVMANAVPSRMIEFDERTLRKLRDVTWRDLVQGAVAYRGHLYLESDIGIADLAPDTTEPHPIRGLAGAVGPVAVDRTRHRLIAIDFGYPTDVWTYRPGQVPVEARDSLKFINGSIAVVQGRIWVAASRISGGAVLERLDPVTLRPVQRAPGRHLFNPVATIIGAGSRVLWVQNRDASGALGCVSARTGRVEQQWRLPGVLTVTSSSDAGAIVATRTDVLGLIMNGCPG